MAAITGAVIAGAATAYGAKQQAGAAKDAARAQESAANLGIQEQRRQFDTFQQNISPYLQAGQSGLNRLTGLLDDPDSIQDSAAYQWRMGQGLQGLDRSAAARGGLYGGGHQTDVLNYAQGLASQEYGNQWSRLAGLAGMGQNAAVGAGSMGQAAAGNIGNLLGNAGGAQAAGAINSANAWSNGLAGLANIAGNYMGGRSSAYQNTGQPAGGWGAFTPNQNVNQLNLATTQPYMGQSAFGQWGQGWGG